MAATLKLTHRAIGVEVRRGTYDVVLDGERVGSLELNDPIEIPIEPGHHTLQVRNARNSSRTKTSTPPRAKPSHSDAAERASCRSFSCPSSFPSGSRAYSPAAHETLCVERWFADALMSRLLMLSPAVKNVRWSIPSETSTPPEGRRDHCQRSLSPIEEVIGLIPGATML